MPMYDTTTAHDFANVCWIGGSPCAGKSAIADALVKKYGFVLYRCDEAYYEHCKIVTAERQPVFHRLIHLSNEELWMRPVGQQGAEEIALYREEFPLILDDLLAYPRTQPVLVEGAALLPECVYPLLSRSRRAIWIVPTGELWRKAAHDPGGSGDSCGGHGESTYAGFALACALPLAIGPPAGYW